NSPTVIPMAVATTRNTFKLQAECARTENPLCIYGTVQPQDPRVPTRDSKQMPRPTAHHPPAPASGTTIASTNKCGVAIASGSSDPTGTTSSTWATTQSAAVAMAGLKLRAVL